MAKVFSVVAAVTRQDQPVGRKQALTAMPVKLTALALKIPVLQPRAVLDLVAPLQQLRPDVGVLFAYGRIIPPKVLSIFPHGIVNIHPSLLPLYRGPSPVAQAILEGCTRTGVSLMLLDAELDHGPLLFQKSVAIEPYETAPELLKRLAEVGTSALIATLPAYLSHRVVPQPQHETLATMTRPLGRDDGRVDWQREAQFIHNQYRAYTPWPGSFTEWNGKRLRCIALALGPSDMTGRPGSVSKTAAGVTVACGRGSIVLRRVQLEGRAVVSAEDFARGRAGFIGGVLG